MLPVLLRRLTASRMPFCRRVSSLLVVLRNTRLRRAPAAACCTFWLGLRSRSTSLQMPPSWYTCGTAPRQAGLRPGWRPAAQSRITLSQTPRQTGSLGRRGGQGSTGQGALLPRREPSAPSRAPCSSWGPAVRTTWGTLRSPVVGRPPWGHLPLWQGPRTRTPRWEPASCTGPRGGLPAGHAWEAQTALLSTMGETDRETDRQRDRERQRQRETQRDKETERDRERQRDRDREAESERAGRTLRGGSRPSPSELEEGFPLSPWLSLQGLLYDQQLSGVPSTDAPPTSGSARHTPGLG